MMQKWRTTERGNVQSSDKENLSGTQEGLGKNQPVKSALQLRFEELPGINFSGRTGDCANFMERLFWGISVETYRFIF